MTIRTSHSDPLEVQWVHAPGVCGGIGMTFCPGKVQPVSMTGGWRRDLRVDLDRLAALGARALVCLVEDWELDDLGVADLHAVATGRGFEVHHLPIVDQHAPDARFETGWAYSGERLRRQLAEGAPVVAFCKGGLGRTGTVAARLLVELGVAPDRAVAAVRAARPLTIETADQECHVLAAHQIAAAVADRRDRLLGALLGGAVGDGFGYAIEFSSLAAVRARHGEAGLAAPVLDDRGRLVVSDDTQMTLFTLEAMVDLVGGVGLADGEAAAARLRASYLDWLDTQTRGAAPRAAAGWLAGVEVMRAERAPGLTCLAALHGGGSGSTRRRVNDSKGCGGVMRVAPIGFWPDRFGAEGAYDLGCRAAAITHGHPTGFLSAGVMAATVGALVVGGTLEAALDGALALAARDAESAEVLRAVERARDLAAVGAASHAQAVASIGEGWIAEEALAVGVYAALAGRDFPEVLSIAANHDGDSDSTASIAGQLFGAAHGFASLPHDWIVALDVLAPTLRLTRRVFDLA